MSAVAADATRVVPSAGSGAVSSKADAGCLHCGLPVPPGADRYCCRGCRAVHAFLSREALGRFYELGGGHGVPAPELRLETRDRAWIDAIEARLESSPGFARVELDVQGIHCAACVWLFETLFARAPGGGRILVNPVLGQIELAVDRTFPFRAWVEDLEAAGYAVGTRARGARSETDPLLVRTGVAVALALNAMMFAVAIYLGLKDGPLFEVVESLGFALAVGSVAVGAPVFFRSAWRSLRAGSLHFDVPISLGILFAFGGSAFAFFAGRPGVYFDSVSVFVALMLTGRWVRERSLERNRRAILESTGVQHLRTRVVRDGNMELVPVHTIKAGDTLRVARGELVPVDAVLRTRAASFSLDWITGEGTPREFAAGDTVCAGAFSAGVRTVDVEAASDFATSPLPSLLAARDADPVGEGTDWWARTARRYVFVVLGVTTAVAVGWWFHSHDLWRVLEVSTAVLVVTCPCAFGLAAPMAYELVLAGLRRSGIFVRSAAFLDRVARVRKVVFDKTGTVTTGLLGVEDAAPLAALSAEDAAVFLAMTQASAHPKSVAIGRALADAGALARQGVEVAEIVGRGLVALVDGHVYRVGETPWVMGFGTGASPEGRGHAAHPGADVALSRDGRLVATVRTVECLRNEAAEEIDALRRSGRSVYLLSGDSPARVEAMARTLGIASERALGAQRPDDKANWVRAHDAHDTLMIGDGLNDGPAVASAWCSGTPAVDRPFLAAHTDFYWTHPGLRPVTLTLRAGQELAQVLRRILAFAWSYNAIAIALAASGAMKPWMAAVLMPVSSIAVLIGTGAALGQKARLWKS